MKKLLFYMVSIKYVFCFVGCFFMYLPSVVAEHLVGGEISYECLGGNTFRVTLTIYRDCYSSGADFDNPASITIFNAAGNVVDDYNLYFPDVEQLPITTEGLCLETVPDVCVERGVYQRNINLPPNAGGYRIVYQRCCRNSTIVNIADPDGTGSTYMATVPPSALGPCNNSTPVFNNFPPIAICANSPLVFDHSATDADGDSLVYSICEPYDGASPFNPQPNIASDPPYNSVTWLPPYSATNQLGGSPVMSIDPVTGLLTAFPTQLGQFVVGICVSEYRNGELLSTNLRDFQFNVTTCAVVLADAFADTDSVFLCGAQSVTLQGTAFGGTIYQWSPSAGLSGAGILNPVATPTQTVTYTLTVINPLLGCQDSDEITIVVNEAAEANAGPDTSICPGTSVSLNGSGNSDATFNWWPTTGLSNAGIANPVATPLQTTAYILTTTLPWGCTASDTVVITVPDYGIMVSIPDINLCPGDSALLSASGGSSTGYLWSTGATSAQILVSQAGQYSVTVTETVNGCEVTASDTATVTIFPAATAVNLSDISLCPGDSALLSATGGSYTGYLWSTGATSAQILVSEAGQYSVTVTETVNGCEVTASDTATVTIIPAATAVNLSDISLCPGDSALLSATGGSYTGYLWSTGETSAQILVSEAGQYSVTVTETVNGCEVTATDTTIVSQIETTLPLSLPDVSLCPGDSALLSATGGSYTGYLWSTGATSAQIMVSDAGQYSVTVTETVNGCEVTASDTSTVTIIPATTALTLSDVSICPGETATLTPAGGGSFSGYVWSTGATSAQITVSQAGLYSVTVTETVNGCEVTATDTATVSITPVATSVTLPDVSICPGETATLTPSGGGSFSGYVWSNGATSAQITVSNTGQYSVTVSETVNGCEVTVSDTATVIAFSAPEPVIGGNFSFIAGQSAALQAQQGFAAYLWSNGQTTPAITVTSAGQYAVTVTDANGCTGTAFAAVAEQPNYSYIIPSAFSPNNDGINDNFMVIVNPELVNSINFYVYNRWGEQVFYSNSLTLPWNGKFKTEDCEIGVYVYFGNISLSNGEAHTFKGNVTLVR
ncbi:hypothetical protein C7N43_36825 [Sphingobacteriales bacterium UPWRP_1]|nr:hypothetical protein C7N43_36825 [Sphingobacteriales bacterium UPWRP_1]